MAERLGGLGAGQGRAQWIIFFVEQVRLVRQAQGRAFAVVSKLVCEAAAGGGLRRLSRRHRDIRIREAQLLRRMKDDGERLIAAVAERGAHGEPLSRNDDRVDLADKRVDCIERPTVRHQRGKLRTQSLVRFQMPRKSTCY